MLVLRYQPITSFHKALLLTLYDVLNVFLQGTSPFEIRRYPLRQFIDVKRYNYTLKLCILQSLNVIRD